MRALHSAARASSSAARYCTCRQCARFCPQDAPFPCAPVQLLGSVQGWLLGLR